MMANTSQGFVERNNIRSISNLIYLKPSFENIAFSGGFGLLQNFNIKKPCITVFLDMLRKVETPIMRFRRYVNKQMGLILTIIMFIHNT